MQREPFNICITCAQRKRQTQELMPEGISRSVPAGRHPAAGWNSWGMLNKAISMGGGQMPTRTKKQDKLSLWAAQIALLLGQQLCTGFYCVPRLVPANVSALKLTVSKGNQQKLQLYLRSSGCSILPLPWQVCILPSLPLGLSQWTQKDFCVYLDQ